MVIAPGFHNLFYNIHQLFTLVNTARNVNTNLKKITSCEITENVEQLKERFNRNLTVQKINNWGS